MVFTANSAESSEPFPSRSMARNMMRASLDASSAIKVDASCTTPMDPSTFGAAPVALLFSWSPAPFESDASHASTSRSSARSLARVMSNDTCVGRAAASPGAVGVCLTS